MRSCSEHRRYQIPGPVKEANSTYRIPYQNIQKRISLGIGIAHYDLEGLATLSLSESHILVLLVFVGAGFAIDELSV